MNNSPNDVLARYGTWYKGDDDEFAHCLVLRSGHCVVLFQGLQVVTVKTHHAPATELDKLKHLLAQQIPPAWPRASYSGYNFITDAEGPSASEIAVFGVRDSDNAPPGQYYAAPADSEVAMLVKTIANID
jgi:hypothetical protein